MNRTRSFTALLALVVALAHLPTGPLTAQVGMFSSFWYSFFSTVKAREWSIRKKFPP